MLVSACLKRTKENRSTPLKPLDQIEAFVSKKYIVRKASVLAAGLLQLQAAAYCAMPHAKPSKSFKGS